MQISDRLKLVISFVSPCRNAADIGTDHGYVPIQLVKSGIVEKVYAMDINQGPLERAREHIEAEKLSEFVEVRQSDGLGSLRENEAETVIIAGMGGELMVKILKNGEKVLKTVKELILSPHSEVFLVRKYLIDSGYDIIKEKMIRDGGKYYTVIKAVRSEDAEETKKLYDDRIYYLYGRKLIEEKDSVLGEYLGSKKRQYEQILAGLEANDSASAKHRKIQMMEEVDCIRRTLGMMEEI